jgi:hypothetical protein
MSGVRTLYFGQLEIANAGSILTQPLNENDRRCTFILGLLWFERRCRGHEWLGIAFSYALLWPTIFAFVVLPGVLIGSRMRTWQSSVILTEIITIVAATMIDHPTVEQLFRPLFVMHLAIAHLALFHHSSVLAHNLTRAVNTVGIRPLIAAIMARRRFVASARHPHDQSKQS